MIYFNVNQLTKVSIKKTTNFFFLAIFLISILSSAYFTNQSQNSEVNLQKSIEFSNNSANLISTDPNPTAKENVDYVNKNLEDFSEINEQANTDSVAQASEISIIDEFESFSEDSYPSWLDIARGSLSAGENGTLSINTQVGPDILSNTPLYICNNSGFLIALGNTNGAGNYSVSLEPGSYYIVAQETTTFSKKLWMNSKFLIKF